MKIKADLHAHCSGDIQDTWISYSARQLIDQAAKLGYKVQAITCHHEVKHTKELEQYAQKKGILLVPGCEIIVEGKEIILINFTNQEISQIKTFDDLRAKKTKNNIVIAPHPYYPYPKCLFSRLIKEKDIFDAIEYCWLYSRIFNLFNWKAKQAAKKIGKPLIGTSDSHTLGRQGQNYIELEKMPKNTLELCKMIQKKQFKLITQPIGIIDMIHVSIKAIINDLTYKKHKKERV